MKQDVYSVLFDFTDEFEKIDKVLLKQVVYRDERLYQSIILEWKHYSLCDCRDLIKRIQNNAGIMDMLSNVQPFVSYGFVSNKLAITFKKDLKLSRKRAKTIIRNIINLC